MAIAAHSMSARLAERIVPNASRSIPALVAVRQGAQALVDTLAKSAPLDGAISDTSGAWDASFTRACEEVTILDREILRVKPSTVVELQLQANIVERDLQDAGEGSPLVAMLLANIRSM